VKVPLVVVRAWPSVVVPEIAGAVVLLGMLSTTDEVTALVSEAEPAKLVAVTMTRRTCPTSDPAKV